MSPAPLDPARPLKTDRNGSVEERIRALEREVGRLGRGQPTIQAGTAAPANTVREGTPYGQQGTRRFWLYLDGAWRYTTLT